MEGAEILSAVEPLPADPKGQTQKAPLEILVRKLALDQLDEVPVRLDLNLHISPAAAADFQPILDAFRIAVVGLFLRIYRETDWFLYL